MKFPLTLHATSLAVALLVVGLTTDAPAATLCGKAFQTSGQLHSLLVKDPTVEDFKGNRRIETLFEHRERAVVLWWFTKPAHRAYPAVVCRRQIRQPGRSTSLTPESSCSRSKPACAALIAAIAKAKF